MQKRITGKRVLAAATKSVVIEESQWNQHLWISGAYFPGYSDTATAEELRERFSENVCGTTACVAGTVVILNLPKGAKYQHYNDEVILADGTRRTALGYARDALGLTRAEADWLFDASRTKEQVIDALDALMVGDRLDGVMLKHDDLW